MKHTLRTAKSRILANVYQLMIENYQLNMMGNSFTINDTNGTENCKTDSLVVIKKEKMK
jgi:hypothetical protein